MRNFWNKIVEWLSKIPAVKRFLFVVGIVISAFFCISIGMKVCIVPALVLGFLKVFIDSWEDGNWDWWDFVATSLGGLLIQIFFVLNLWWF